PDVAGAIVAKLRRHRVGAQKRRHQLKRALGVQLGDGLEALDLVSGAQAVATFDLNRGNAKAKQPIQTAAGQLLQLILAGAADLCNRGVDAAARRGDLLVGPSLEPLLEFLFAAARPDEVRVTVNETGQDGFAGRIDYFGGTVVGGKLAGGADPDDTAGLGHD